jgi:hypothetical protein
MKILNYIIPKSLQDNDFIKSLNEQYSEKGDLSQKQTEALENMIGISLEYYHFDFVPTEDTPSEYHDLLAKLKRNRFRKEKNRNTCIRALDSIVSGKPRWDLINTATGANFHYFRRW